MDQIQYTAVQLHRTGDSPEEVFCVIGGAGQWYMGDSVLRWEFENPSAGEDEVTLWADMDFSCKMRNVCTDIEKVVAIAKRFFETGNYESLAEADLSSL